MANDRVPIGSGNAVTIRGLPTHLKARLRIRAAHNARSMEAEARAILESALSAGDDDSTDLGAFARGLFAPLGGVDLAIPARVPARAAPDIVIPAAEGEIAIAGSGLALEPEEASAPSSSADPGTEGDDDAGAGQGGIPDRGPPDGEVSPPVAAQSRKGARR